MEFKEIQFKDGNAKRVYDNYIKRVKKVVQPISKSDQQEVLMEFNSHIYEAIQKNKSSSELDTLLNTIDKLGEPEEVLKPLIADKLLEKATSSFNPLHIFRALALNVTNGISYVIFAFLYLLLGCFIVLSIAKLIRWNKVGVFVEDGEFRSLGYSDLSVNYQEVLGFWFIPLMLFLTVAFYFLITFLLKSRKTKWFIPFMLILGVILLYFLFLPIFYIL